MWWPIFFTLQPTTKKMITAVLTNVNEVHKFKHPLKHFHHTAVNKVTELQN